MAGVKVIDKHPQKLKNNIVEGGLLLWPNIATAGQKYVTNIGNWPGPHIFIVEGGILLRPELLWPDCTVAKYCLMILRYTLCYYFF